MRNLRDKPIEGTTAGREVNFEGDIYLSRSQLIERATKNLKMTYRDTRMPG